MKEEDILKIRYSLFPDTISNYGYLSKQARLRRTTLNSEYEKSYELGRELVRRAMRKLRVFKKIEVQDRHMIGLNLWIDAIETLQGALLLADRNLVKAAMSATRTGLELMLHACGYWVSLETAKKMARNDEIGLLRIKRTICKRYPDLVKDLPFEPELSKEDVRLENRSVLNIADIAELVNLEEFYYGMHKQLGFSGTHANANSATPRMVVNEEGVTIKQHGDNKLLGAAYYAVNSCLNECLKQMEIHVEPLILASS